MQLRMSTNSLLKIHQKQFQLDVNKFTPMAEQKFQFDRIESDDEQRITKSHITISKWSYKVL